jgi:NAD(P)-dependent dehydrogenase (short-subunit alcohol dehydrogenase family)
MTYLITGASRGIGLELTRLALTDGNKVIATVRSISRSAELKALAQESGSKLLIHELDASSDESVTKAAKEISEPIDVLINNAGVYLDSNMDQLSELDLEIVSKTFETNTLGPMRVTKAFLSHLSKSKSPIVANVSSLMGSMTDNRGGGSYAYRMSKAALNMFSKNLSIENPEWLVLSLHPGWVQTDMGGKGATTTVTESAQGILNLIKSSKRTDSGKFFDYRGRELAW